MHATTVVGYAYLADTWCPECGNAHAAELIAQGKHPTRDTDSWPQPIFATNESDYPQHCTAGAHCLDPITLSDGRKIGALLETTLTTHGRQCALEGILAEVVRLAHPLSGDKPGSCAIEVWSPAFDIPIPPGLSAVATLAALLKSPLCVGASLTIDDIGDIVSYYEQTLQIDLSWRADLSHFTTRR